MTLGVSCITDSLLLSLRSLSFSLVLTGALIGFLSAVDWCWLTRNVIDVPVCACRFVVSFRARSVDVVGTHSRTGVVDAIVSDVVVDST